MKKLYHPVHFRSGSASTILQDSSTHPSGFCHIMSRVSSGVLQEFFRVSSGIPEAASGFLQHFLKKTW
jgi:hypothetical protein